MCDLTGNNFVLHKALSLVMEIVNEVRSFIVSDLKLSCDGIALCTDPSTHQRCSKTLDIVSYALEMCVL